MPTPRCLRCQPHDTSMPILVALQLFSRLLVRCAYDGAPSLGRVTPDGFLIAVALRRRYCPLEA